MEKVVLGAAMLEKEGLSILMNKVKTKEIFYSDKNEMVYDCIVELYNNSDAVDILTVCSKAKELGYMDTIGGTHYIALLTETVNGSANMETHIAILYELYIKRCEIKLAYQILAKAFDSTTDAFEILDDITLKIDKVRNSFIKNSMQVGDDLAKYTLSQLQLNMTNPNKNGVLTPIQRLDDTTGGFRSGKLIIIAGRPGSGKSALAISFIEQCIKDHVSIGVFSLEMPAIEIQERMFSSITTKSGTKVKYSQISKGSINETQYLGVKLISNQDYYKYLVIDDTAGIDLHELRSRAIVMKQKHGVKMIVIDYLQLIRVRDSGNKNMEGIISEISVTLKNLSKELEIPIIALAQLSREVEKRSDKKPQLSDLRGSGSLEQDSDMVIFILRPFYYKMEMAESDDQFPMLKAGDRTDNYAIAIIAKNRGGTTTDVPYFYEPSTNHITDWKLNEEIPSENAQNVMNKMKEIKNINGLKDFDVAPF